MRRFEVILTVGLCPFLFLTSGESLAAQGEEPACAVAALATSGGKLTDRDAAVLSECRQSGPDALAKVWREPDARDLDRLVEVSSMLRDSRLFNAALSATQSESGQRTTRMAALRVLASYYSPELSPSITYLNSGTLGDPIPRTMDKEFQDGSSPLQSGSRTKIQQALLRLSKENRDKKVSHAALILRQGLAFFDPSNTPIATNAIALSAGCGPRVTLTSHADIDLNLRVRVLQTNYDQQFVVRGSQHHPGGKLTLALPAGIVVVGFGNKEVARLSDRSAPCPPGLTRH